MILGAQLSFRSAHILLHTHSRHGAIVLLTNSFLLNSVLLLFDNKRFVSPLAALQCWAAGLHRWGQAHEGLVPVTLWSQTIVLGQKSLFCRLVFWSMITQDQDRPPSVSQSKTTFDFHSAKQKLLLPEGLSRKWPPRILESQISRKIKYCFLNFIFKDLICPNLLFLLAYFFDYLWLVWKDCITILLLFHQALEFYLVQSTLNSKFITGICFHWQLCHYLRGGWCTRPCSFTCYRVWHPRDATMQKL